MTIERIIDKRERDLGGGFVVGRVLPFHARRMVGPFIFFDHLGPLELAPGIPRDLDVRPPPHIGLSPVTYLYSGRSEEHTSELQSLMRLSYAVFCLNKKKINRQQK